MTHHLQTDRNTHAWSHWAFIASALATVLACIATDAGAANARSEAGTVTNNQTYTGFGTVYNDGSRTSAERSDVHTRPLAIDNRVNTPAPSAVGHTTVTQQGRVITTVREEPLHPAAIHLDSDDVNARADAGVIVTHPVTSTTPVRSNATGGLGIDTHINP